MNLSLVDLSPIGAGADGVDALRDSVALAAYAERLGYERFWVAEHHGTTQQAGSAPEVLIARIAALTDRIRVGSGTVLLNHYSPFKVAEVFRTLHAMSPGRIDLGLGRANGMPAADYALQRDRSQIQRLDDYDEQVLEVMAWLDRAFSEEHPFRDVAILPSVAGGPEPWVLGSSPSSAALAGRLGLRYCFAGFINPGAGVAASEAYRSSFRPSPFASGVAEPHLALGMNVSVGETDADGDRLRATVELFYRRLRAGQLPHGPLPAPEDAIAELGATPAPSQVAPGSWPQHISGGPQRVREMLEIMAADLDAKELVIQDLIARRDDRLRSYELLADVFELTQPRRDGAEPTTTR